MTDYDARQYLSSKFIKTAELRAEGPRRLRVQAVEETDGLPKNGQAAKKELVLVFPDGSKFGLRNETNRQRMIELFGWRTSGWIGKDIELYFSPDVPNPQGGAPGGSRLRRPEAVTGPKRTYRSDLEQQAPLPETVVEDDSEMPL